MITGLTGQHQGVKKVTAVTGDLALASIELMAHLQSLVSSLVDDVTHKRCPDSWSSRLKNIYQVVWLAGKESLASYLPCKLFSYLTFSIGELREKTVSMLWPMTSIVVGSCTVELHCTVEANTKHNGICLCYII